MQQEAYEKWPLPERRNKEGDEESWVVIQTPTGSKDMTFDEAWADAFDKCPRWWQKELSVNEESGLMDDAYVYAKADEEDGAFDSDLEVTDLGYAEYFFQVNLLTFQLPALKQD